MTGDAPGHDSAGSCEAQVRPWWKKKRFAIPIGTVVGLGALGAVIGDPDQDATPATTTTVIETTVAAPVDITAPPETEPPVTVPAATTTSTSTSTNSTTTTAAATTTSTTAAPPSTLSPAVDNATQALSTLRIAEPDPAREPYDRDRYDGQGWADDDGDCLSTRHELLQAFSTTPVVLASSGCSVEAGTWVDPYDGATFVSADQVSIDHLVPLADAHRSGAWKWDDATKNRFSND